MKRDLSNADLLAIEGRVEAVWESRHDFDSYEYKAAIAASASDVPYLLDEVQRLRAVLQQPIAPNEVTVLRDLPFNAVLRGVGDDSVFLVTITPAFSPEVASAYYESLGVTEWAVLYYPEGVSDGS